MAENAPTASNKHLYFTAAIVIFALAVVTIIYWDRQKQRDYRLAAATLEVNANADIPAPPDIDRDTLRRQAPVQGFQQQMPGPQPQVIALPGVGPSYRNAVSMVKPSVVSVNVVGDVVDNGQMNNGQGGGAPMRQVAQTMQPGGFGDMPGVSFPGVSPAQTLRNYMACLNCGTKVPHQMGVPATSVSCPNCGMRMALENAANNAAGVPQQQNQMQPVAGFQQNTPAGNTAFSRTGSGVIVNQKGYVLTSHHVIHGAPSITVTVTDGQSSRTYPAKIVSESPDIDLAMLKIITKKNISFSPAAIGDSARLSVGDEVLAIGSPYGLQQSVTLGIVSNTKRALTVGNATFSALIQTDASMNPGSSGGPLVNASGEVVGINTAIYSPDRSFTGIGFAVPINRARDVFSEFIEVSPMVAARQMVRNMMPDPNGGQGQTVAQVQPGQGLMPNCPPMQAVIANGQVQTVAQVQPGQGMYPGCPPTRLQGGTMQPMATVPDTTAGGLVHLGIEGQAITSANNKSFGVPMSRGVYVDGVLLDSSAWVAGLMKGDVILRLNDRAVKDEQMLWDLLAEAQPGSKIKLAVYRGGKNETLYVENSPSTGVKSQVPGVPVAVPQAPFDVTDVAPPGLGGALAGGELGVGEMEALGMGVETLAPEWRVAYNISADIKQGVIIAEVAGLASNFGLLAGDVIQTINNKPVNNIVDYLKVMGKADLKKGIVLGINRQGKRFSVVVKG